MPEPSPVLQNRAFQQVVPGKRLPTRHHIDNHIHRQPGTSEALYAWTAVNGATIKVVNDTPALSTALPNSLQVIIPSNSTVSAGSPGVSNKGYWGAYFACLCT